MPVNSMGTKQDWITVQEAAEILNGTPAQVYRMARRGKLRRVGDLTQNIRFLLSDVCAIAELGKKRITLPQLNTKLAQVLAQARGLERRMESLERVMGLVSRQISYDDIEVLALYLKAQEALKEPVLEVEEIREWTQVFLAIHEEFFDLLETYAKDPEPWRPFLDLAKKVYEDRPLLDRIEDEEAMVTNAELELGRRNLRQAAWAYVCSRRGSKAAMSAFPEVSTNPVTKLLQHSILIPDSQGRRNAQ